jgi:hypothetical protein
MVADATVLTVATQIVDLNVITGIHTIQEKA